MHGNALQHQQRQLERPSPVVIHVNQQDPIVQFTLPSLQQYFLNRDMPNQDQAYFQITKYEFPPFNNTAAKNKIGLTTFNMQVTVQSMFDGNYVTPTGLPVDYLVPLTDGPEMQVLNQIYEQNFACDLEHINTPDDFAKYMRLVLEWDAMRINVLSGGELPSYIEDIVPATPSNRAVGAIFYAWFSDFFYDSSTGKYAMELKVPDDRRYIYTPFPDFNTPLTLAQEYDQLNRVANISVKFTFNVSQDLTPPQYEICRQMIGATASEYGSQTPSVTYNFSPSSTRLTVDSGQLYRSSRRTDYLRMLSDYRHGRYENGLVPPYPIDSTLTGQLTVMQRPLYSWLSMYKNNFRAFAYSDLANIVGPDNYVYLNGIPQVTMLNSQGNPLNYAMVLPPNKTLAQTVGTSIELSELRSTQKIRCPLQALRNFRLEFKNANGELCQFLRPFLLEITITFDV